MSKFIPTTTKNACRICGDISGKCREISNNENLYLCMTYQLKDHISGFKYLGLDKSQLWGKWLKINDTKGFNHANKRNTPPHNINKQGGCVPSPLTPKEKNNQYRSITSWLGLTSDHKKNLLDRGVSDLIISKGLFFTLDNTVKLPHGVNDDFVGVTTKKDGYYLAQRVKGFSCPVFDKDGYVVSYQIRTDNNNNNRYLWAKGKRSSHLPNNKLPNTFINSNCLQKASIKNIEESNSKDLNLSEGILKPFISFMKFGGHWCGASGGQFDIDQISDYIESFEIERVILNPDAGSTRNDNVIRSYKRIISSINQKYPEIKILVRWWNQENKTDLDIDEINFQTFKESKKMSKKEWLNYYRNNRKKLNNKDTNSLDPQWLEYKSFNPDEIINTKYIKPSIFKIPLCYEGVALKSGLGTGKTTALAKYIENSSDTQRWISLGYRNTLNKQFCKEANFEFIHDHDVLPCDSNGYLNVNLSLCIHSLLRIPEEQFIGKNIILDEVESVINALLFDNNIKHPEEVLDRFITALYFADNIYCLDGLLTDKTVELIEELSGKTIKKIANKYQNSFHYQVYNNGNCSALEEEILKAALTNKIAVCSDSQVQLEALHYKLESMGLKVLRIDSKTCNDPFIRDLLINFNKNLIKGYHATLFTPVTESGVSVAIRNYFKHHYGFFFNVINHDAILQMMGRIRDNNCIKKIWITDNEIQQKSLMETLREKVELKTMNILQNDFVDNTNSKASLEILDDLDDHSLLEYQMTKNVMNNYEKQNLKECVIYSLKKLGHSVEIIDNKDTDFSIKEEKIDVKIDNSKEISESDKLENTDNIDKNSLKWKTSDDNPDKVSYYNATVRELLPGIEETPLWDNETKKTVKVSKDVIRELSPRENLVYEIFYRDKDNITRHENRYLYENFYLSKLLFDQKIEKLLLTHEEFKRKNKTLILNICRYKSRHGFIGALKELNLDYFIYGNNTWDKNNKKVKRIAERIREDKRLQNLLNYTPNEKQSDVAIVNSILKLININCSYTQKTVNGKKIRIYSRQELLDEQKIIYDCVERRLIKVENDILLSKLSKKAEVENNVALQQIKTIDDENEISLQEVILVKEISEGIGQVLQFLCFVLVRWAKDMNFSLVLNIFKLFPLYSFKT